MSNTQSGDFFGGLQDAIRENPVSAALVGMGVLWMFTGGAKLSTAAALLSPAARAAASGIGQGLQTSGDAVGAVAEGVRSAGSRVSDGVVDTISDAATSAGETARQACEAAKNTAVDSTSNAKTAVTRQSGQVAGQGLLANDVWRFHRHLFGVGCPGRSGTARAQNHKCSAEPIQFLRHDNLHTRLTYPSDGPTAVP